ncbi:MAG: hypothetical protein PW845_12945 [Pseudomonas sp.]|uniref:hypothetical protein n=1 Tax=Pseudomonas abieticivorans TaxID=2931382 RepID=UPI0020BD965B|nr:hypothetical protein [Pseudomonas sp. PIA16]MDE1166265.1 hypothetical protein [Pseudomonas sp.]
MKRTVVMITLLAGSLLLSGCWPYWHDHGHGGGGRDHGRYYDDHRGYGDDRRGDDGYRR